MMEFQNKLKGLADRVANLKENIQTEEATKNAFIMPFIQILVPDGPIRIILKFCSNHLSSLSWFSCCFPKPLFVVKSYKSKL